MNCSHPGVLIRTRRQPCLNRIIARVSIASAGSLHILLHSPLRRGTKGPSSKSLQISCKRHRSVRIYASLAWYSGKIRPVAPGRFPATRHPVGSEKNTTGLSSHVPYRSPGHGSFWAFTQNYSGPRDNQRNNTQSGRCFTVMRRRIRATKFGIAASSCTSTAVCESKEYGKL